MGNKKSVKFDLDFRYVSQQIINQIIRLKLSKYIIYVFIFNEYK